ncbi:hypothetical protein PICMEDRAFT_20620, partial [Pichia membranifaciens NRRL Y-2026]
PREPSSVKSKTIKPPGSNTTRVSVACDRCRKKKIRCFYDNDDPIVEDEDGNRQCANCKVVGLECIFTDKLARKAFPRGYTESLEERVRELEYENKKLQKLLSLKNTNKNSLISSSNSISTENTPTTVPSHVLNTENVSRLDVDFKPVLHTHDENCNCGMHHSVINRPVSIAGSVDIDQGDLSDDESLYSTDSHYSRNNDSDSKNRFVYNPNSFEQINAPGAAAAISLQNKLRTKNFLNLANLIAASIPRSTEETLFIPTLLARIIKTHGFDSKAPYLTARSIALLKQAYNEEERYNLFPITFKGVNFNDLNKSESKAFFQSLNLPNNMNLDICITIFFNTWNTVIPVMNKEIFMANYKKFIKSRDANYEDGELVGFEKFGELLVIITCLVMISNERNNNGKSSDKKISSNSEILQFYDHIIKQLIQSNMSSICSISSLQIITIELLYCLATDDLTTSYELRGRMITMCQQLRLHRCPAAVLGSNGSSVSKLQQGERRILFWCIYTLDSFSAFILGVPRLLKDYEIECALPSSSSSDKENKDSDISLITFQNNVQLSLVGKVCDSALSVMRYSKVLGTIVDSIFRRSEGLKQTNINESKCLIMEDLLETWRRNLPANVSFNTVHNSKDINIIDNLNETQLTLYYLYYQAKALIYMPLLAGESTFNLTSSKCSPAFISIQQATTSILTTMRVLNTSKHNFYFLPLPINIARQTARFSLMAARNSLEYTRGGSLFQEAKLLLTSIINELKIENKIGLLGCLSNNCVGCLEHAIDAILSQPKTGSMNNLDPVESVKKESKKKSTGSPLKKVSNLESFAKKPSSMAPQQFLQTQQENLQKQIQLLQQQAKTQAMAEAEIQVQRQQVEQQRLQNSLFQDSSKNSHADVPFSVKSFSDLLMFNDFGVDASLGLPFIDFELDNTQTKKQKMDPT